MKKIAITGCIASGKSLLLYELNKRGFSTFDCDKTISELYKDDIILQKVKKIFPEVFEDNTFKKTKLREIVINDKLKIKQLEEILYPFLYKKMKDFEFFQKKMKVKIIFFEVPLLFEKHREKYFDNIIVVDSTVWHRRRNFMNKGFGLKVFSMLNTMQWNNSKKIAIAKRNQYLLFSLKNLNNMNNKIDILLRKI